MSEESNKYCTLIDKFGEIADDNKDYKKVFMLLSKLCMLSLLTKRVTFLLPVGKALTALSKMSAEKQREQMKRHIIGGAFTKDELMERERVYTRMTTSDGDDYKRIAYVVNKEAGTIGGIKIGKEIIVVGGSTKDSKHIPVGVAFEVEELLSEPGEEVPMRTKGPVRKGRKDKVMEGGGWPFGSPLEYVADQSLVDYVELGAQELRWAIVEQYRKAWPLTVFGIDSEYSWYQWMWASLLAFLKEQIPNFYWVYSPYLGMDPFASLDLLFEHYVQENYNNYILPDELLHQWTQSRWFLYNDPTILRESFTYLAGGGQRQSGGGWPFDSFISLNLDSANRYVAVGKQAIGEYMRYNNPEKLREGIVKVYKKVYEEPNFLLGETRAIYKKVDEEPFVVGLHNDLRRFLNSRFRYHSEFDQLYPSFLKCDSCGKSKGLLGYLFGVGGGGKSDSVARAVLKSVLQYDTTTMEIDLGESKQFRFPMEFLQDFVMSPFFMYMSITDKPDLSKMAEDSIEQQKKNEEDIQKHVVEQLHSQTGPTISLTQPLQLPEEPERLTQHFGFRANDAPFAHSLASL
jgi:hypothetical protein